MNNDKPEVPETVGDLLGPDLREQGTRMTWDDGFDPRELPGAEVMFDDGDVQVVAVPISQVPVGMQFGAGASVLGETLGGPLSELMAAFVQAGWAAEEVESARERHGATARGEEEDEFSDAFSELNVLGEPFMNNERLFRAHCTELLDRVAAGEPLERGTDAEIVGLLVEQFEAYPFCNGLYGLYFRLTKKVLPDVFEESVKEWRSSDPEFDLDAFLKSSKEDADIHEAELRDLLTRDRHPKTGSEG